MGRSLSTMCMAVVFALLSCAAASCGSDEKPVKKLEGEFFWSKVTSDRVAFTLGPADAAVALNTVSSRKPTEHLPWQGAAVFAVTFEDGSVQEYQVTDSQALLIDGTAYEADTDALLAFIWSKIEHQ